MIPLRLASLLPCLLAAPLLSQQTLQVGPGMPFADIQSAINASAPGDTIAIQHGPLAFVYGGFTVAHSLTIRTDPPTAVDLDKARCGSMVANLGPGAHLCVQGVHVSFAQITGGLVTLEGAIVNPIGVLAVTTPVLTVTQSNVVFRRHFQIGTAQIDGSMVAAIDSEFAGPSAFGLPGPAVRLNQSVGFFSQCSIDTISPYSGSMGLQVNAGSRADLVDCVVRGVPTSGLPWPPMPSLVVNAGGVARQHRCTFADGTGAGTGIVGVVQQHTMLGATLAEPLLLVGNGMNVQFRAEPLDVVFVMATFQLGPPTLVPLVEPEQWGFAANGFVVIALFANGAGLATFGTAIPNNPSFRGLGIWLMGVSGLAFPLQMSVPVGGLLQ